MYVWLGVALVLLPNVVFARQFAPEDMATRHLRDDKTTARRLGLSPSTVRLLRVAAGIADEDDEFVDRVDTRMVAARGHYLLVSSGGNGHCLTVNVLRRTGDGFTQFWSVDATPDGAGLCRASPRNPAAGWAGGRIIITIPVFDYEHMADERPRRLVYEWDGMTYRLAPNSQPN